MEEKRQYDGQDSEKSKPRGEDQREFASHATEVQQLSTKLENPLAGLSEDELLADATAFAERSGLKDHAETFRRGAILAHDPANLAGVPGLTDEERTILEREKTHRWDQPFMIYYVAVCSAMAAVVQGMDEAVVNGAQIFYYKRFGIDNPEGKDSIALIQGLVNSAPYLCCFVFACWLTSPLNYYLGRRGTIFWSCVIAGLASIWEAFTYSWPQLFVARLLLGLGIGPKSATAPVYGAECAPAPIRGALVMQWQMWTAFGIALGDIVSVIFVDITPNVAWRLMLGSTVVAPIFVCAMIYLAPESPRWYMLKGRPADAYQSMLRLRRCDLQAARDLYYMEKLLQVERESQKGGWKRLLKDMWVVKRVRRAAMSSGLVMFMQQFCGVNVIAYYSSQVFVQSGFTEKNALLTTMGTGITNWLFAIPALYTIDTFGRRNLLLVTFPLMSICLLITGFGFFLPEGTGRLAMVAAGLYLFEVAYSPGEGPVPFTYSAEAFPLYIRDFGMSYATAVCWGFNFVLAITFPLLLTAFKPQGAFGWYAAWCLIGWVLVFLFLPETKALTLEELDLVFSVPTGKHASYQVKNLGWHLRRLFGRREEPLPPLYAMDKLVGA
ncbi:hypothetical protein AURDEDRAFT_83358 [Auricularia subglabra TFB-10046 SS5]|nr:hypothetical protein AURDEDRAFT_83358 [Auricularia subglabra TFB-10046 SS5]